MARNLVRAHPCDGPTLRGGRCLRPRLSPPCADHTPHALARRVEPDPWTRRPEPLRTPRRRGLSLRALLPTPWPVPVDAPGNAEHVRHWLTPRTRAAVDCFASLLPAERWRRVCSPAHRADCPTLEALARVCESPTAVTVGALRRIADDGLVDLAPTPEHRIARDLARAKEEQLGLRAFVPGAAVERPGPHLADLALSLRLLGVLACAVQGRAPWCPCLATLLARGPLPEPTAVFDLATRFATPYGPGSGV
ncbi:hypothetical protein [Nocardiopsis lambiniae]|uniref:MarR family transcriptional regulator n=1 Tax=Nocardiopsis lambiniae TaxID=3075539 RepID=A0ABU2MB58_9ACTN|nr:hypothetical protein [Nocardiopsis sp. DSM 44743]MDT0329360.1 hypothetical protein [Nocardiopsis sp. DSM 44743]